MNRYHLQHIKQIDGNYYADHVGQIVPFFQQMIVVVIMIMVVIMVMIMSMLMVVHSVIVTMNSNTLEKNAILSIPGFLYLKKKLYFRNQMQKRIGQHCSNAE